MKIIPAEFYLQDDVVQLSRDLVGKFLMTDFGEGVTGGMIVETEAYRGPEDRASHAYNNRRTARTEVMYKKGGIAYVYLCYGMHHLFNVVTNVDGIPHAILIRAIVVSDGLDIILKRRHKTCLDKTVTSGPATVTQALGIKTSHNGISLRKKPIWIEDRGIRIRRGEMVAGKRVGIDYAGEDALLPWRFQLKKEP